MHLNKEMPTSFQVSIIYSNMGPWSDLALVCLVLPLSLVVEDTKLAKAELQIELNVIVTVT